MSVWNTEFANAVADRFAEVEERVRKLEVVVAEHNKRLDVLEREVLHVPADHEGRIKALEEGLRHLELQNLNQRLISVQAQVAELERVSVKKVDLAAGVQIQGGVEPIRRLVVGDQFCPGCGCPCDPHKPKQLVYQCHNCKTPWSWK